MSWFYEATVVDIHFLPPEIQELVRKKAKQDCLHNNSYINWVVGECAENPDYFDNDAIKLDIFFLSKLPSGKEILIKYYW